jgi:allantoinase
MNAPNPAGSRMLPTDRIAYSAITDRPPLKLPGGARMAIWVIVNVEEWDPKDTMPRTVLTQQAPRSPTRPPPPPPPRADARYSELVLA